MHGRNSRQHGLGQNSFGSCSRSYTPCSSCNLLRMASADKKSTPPRAGVCCLLLSPLYRQVGKTLAQKWLTKLAQAQVPITNTEHPHQSGKASYSRGSGMGACEQELPPSTGGCPAFAIHARISAAGLVPTNRGGPGGRVSETNAQERTKRRRE